MLTTANAYTDAVIRSVTVFSKDKSTAIAKCDGELPL